LQESLYCINNILIDPAPEVLPFPLTRDQPRILKLLKMMRNRRARKVHAVAHLCERPLDAAIPKTAGLSPATVNRPRLCGRGCVALLIDHQKDFQPLFVRQGLEDF